MSPRATSPAVFSSVTRLAKSRSVTCPVPVCHQPCHVPHCHLPCPQCHQSCPVPSHPTALTPSVPPVPHTRPSITAPQKNPNPTMSPVPSLSSMPTAALSICPPSAPQHGTPPHGSAQPGVLKPPRCEQKPRHGMRDSCSVALFTRGVPMAGAAAGLGVAGHPSLAGVVDLDLLVDGGQHLLHPGLQLAQLRRLGVQHHLVLLVLLLQHCGGQRWEGGDE